jgi:hypothetical protein
MEYARHQVTDGRGDRPSFKGKDDAGPNQGTPNPERRAWGEAARPPGAEGTDTRGNASRLATRPAPKALLGDDFADPAVDHDVGATVDTTPPLPATATGDRAVRDTAVIEDREARPRLPHDPGPRPTDPATLRRRTGADKPDGGLDNSSRCHRQLERRVRVGMAAIWGIFLHDRPCWHTGY